MFEQLTWPSLRWRREILCITLFHLILHTRPPPLDSCLFPFASTNTVRSTCKPKQLILPPVRTSRYVKSFFFRSALLWNTLPANLQNITCHRKFRRTLKHTGQHTSTQQSFAFCREVFHDEPCTMPSYTHVAQLATLFYVFSSLPSTCSSSLLLLPFFLFFYFFL